MRHMRLMNLVVCGLAVGTLGFGALAQPAEKPAQPAKEKSAEKPGEKAAQPEKGGERPAGRPGPGGPGGDRMPMGLAPEKATAAQELEATGVAKRLGLKEDQTKALVKAYTEARTSHAAAEQKLRKELADKAMNSDPDNRAAMREEAMKANEEMNKAERAKFEKALGSAIPADQSAKALASLGTFTRQWDTWVDALAGFKLEAAKQQDALNAIEDFVVAQSKARAGAGGDREAIRTAMQESRDKLTASMKKVLSEEQFTKFEESMRMGGGRGGPGGGRPNRGEGKPDDKGGG